MNTARMIRNHICLPLASILALNAVLTNAMADPSEVFEGTKGTSETSIETPQIMSKIVHPLLLKALSAAKPGDLLDIRISFESPTVMNVEKDSTGSFGSDSDVAIIDGVPLGQSAFADHLRERQQLRLYKGALREVARRAMMERWLLQMGLDVKEALEKALASDMSSLEVQLDAGTVLRIIDTLELSGEQMPVIAIELQPDGGPAIAGAMQYSNVDPGALNDIKFQGQDVGIFVTEFVGCPANGFTSDYERVDGGGHWHGDWVVGVARAVSPSSYIYCSGSPRLPTLSELNGINGNPPIYVANASFMWWTTFQEYTTTDRDWDEFAYNNDLSIFVAAGNNSPETGQAVTTPSKGFNVMSVGNVNDATGQMAFNSAWLDPETDNEKPDITAPGTNISAGGQVDSGTSAASSHAAAIAADYMDEVAGLRDRPYLLRSLMVATATLQETGNAGGADSLGLGGLNFLNGASAFSWFFHYWDGSNSYYNSTWNPYHTSQGNVLSYTISQGEQVHAAIAWNIRADYTFANKVNTYPIGQDYNLFVYDPDGVLVDGSASSRNPYERVEFTAHKSGSYMFRIVRAANRDTAGRYELGFTILMQ